jgi:hypothetical protein
VRALIEPYLQRAREEGVSAFLEASNVHARDVYAHLGFNVVEAVRFGEGYVDEDGMVYYGMVA